MTTTRTVPLDAYADAEELWVGDELSFVWRAAREEAHATYRGWRCNATLEGYASYLAAQDRADAAQDALANWCRSTGHGAALGRPVPYRSSD